jgi:O-antigen/teichoic acid export membrane protein
MTIKERFLQRRRDIFFIISNVSTPAFGFIGSVIAAKFLTPFELGVNQTVMLIPSYFFFMQLGVYSGLNRNIAYYQGKGDDEKVGRQISTSYKFSFYNAMAGCLFAIAFLIYHLIAEKSSLYALMDIAIFAFFLFQPFYLHFDTVIRARQDFKASGRFTLYDNMLNMTCSISMIFLGYTGMILKNTNTFILGFLYRFRYTLKTYGVNAKFHKQEFVDLVKVGAPIALAGYLYGLNVVADRSVIALSLDPQSVGVYSIANLIIVGFQTLPTAISMLIYPRAAHMYGKTNSMRSLRRYVYLALVINIAAIIPFALIGYLFIGKVITLFLPKYIAGIGAAKIACLTSISLAYMGCSIIFMVTKKNHIYIAGLCMSLIITWILSKLALGYGYGLEGVASAKLISNSFLFVFVVAVSVFLTRRD